MGNLAVDIGSTFLGPGHFLTQLTGVSSLVSIILRLALAISGIVLTVFIIMGGIGIIGGAGSDNPEQVAKGRQAVTSALIGFIVVFTAYWIVRLIELITGLNLIS